ncbi:ABC transporter permease [Salinarimonas soli]|uniref:ABC transporter permease subunit n=1 Tax=Salinarimonas soli TaxID=1638099 RepID=A0A5B2VPW5_9HYPH|nr:ABC transporter permease subunit [Salinarimonas soli]KAA2241171.1 ABC transporter permease subunit [Salinarimonas soli]
MWLRLAPAVTLALLIGPIVVGLAWTLLPAFGHLPAIGVQGPSLQPWRALLATPGLAASLQVTVTAGLGATILSLGLASAFCALASGSTLYRRAARFLGPLLSTPHSAIALGFAFLIAPSGWLVRLVSPELTGWSRPPAGLVTVGDRFGLSLMGGLLLKEVPYLVLMVIGASNQVPVRQALTVSRALGQRGPAAWLKVVLPQIYPQIRLPLYAVLAFSLSVVDIAIILGPGQPPPVAVLATRWFSDPDLALYPVAAAAAVLQLAIVGAAILCWHLAERPAGRLGRLWIERGSRGALSASLVRVAGAGALAVGALGLAAILLMAVWSISVAWRYPDALPGAFALTTWRAQAGAVAPLLANTVLVGAASTLLALALTLGCLENEGRVGRRGSAVALWLVYLPLLVPQIAFLFGVQVALVRLSLDGTLAAVVWSHLVFVLPYVFLSLADPYRALDPRYAATAAALGADPGRVFVTIKLPMLVRPVLISAAVGFAVSVGQYLATLFPGSGRIATLTTDAVTLSSGADRRITGVYAVLQAALPLIVYGAALALPAALHRNRAGLRP